MEIDIGEVVSASHVLQAIAKLNEKIENDIIISFSLLAFSSKMKKLVRERLSKALTVFGATSFVDESIKLELAGDVSMLFKCQNDGTASVTLNAKESLKKAFGFAEEKHFTLSDGNLYREIQLIRDTLSK
jgi:hypothetical protein